MDQCIKQGHPEVTWLQERIDLTDSWDRAEVDGIGFHIRLPGLHQLIDNNKESHDENGENRCSNNWSTVDL